MYEDLYVQIDSKKYYEKGEVAIISEVLNADMINGNTGKAPKGGFEILRPKPFCDMLDESDVPFCKVLSLFVGGKNSENCVDLSLQQITDKTGLAKSTVRSAIKKMERSKFVVQGIRKVMVNPYILHRGDSKRESYLSANYDKLAKEYKKGDYAKNSEEEESSGNER